MLLTSSEVADLTGYQRPSAQMRWLDAQAIPYLVGGDGLPKVLRAPLIARLGGLAVTSPKKEPQLRFRNQLPDA